jgi:hypothetical protein
VYRFLKKLHPMCYFRSEKKKKMERRRKDKGHRRDKLEGVPVCNNDWPRAINFFLGHISAAFVLSRLLLTHASIIYSFPGEMTFFFPLF